jgi:hypothetical protein
VSRLLPSIGPVESAVAFGASGAGLRWQARRPRLFVRSLARSRVRQGGELSSRASLTISTIGKRNRSTRFARRGILRRRHADEFSRRDLSATSGPRRKVAQAGRLLATHSRAPRVSCRRARRRTRYRGLSKRERIRIWRSTTARPSKPGSKNARSRKPCVRSAKTQTYACAHAADGNAGKQWSYLELSVGWQSRQAPIGAVMARVLLPIHGGMTAPKPPAGPPAATTRR